MKTACQLCSHRLLKQRSHYSDGPQIWYQDYCMASPLPLLFDYLTGEDMTEQVQKYAYCRDINKGNCTLYKAKEE